MTDSDAMNHPWLSRLSVEGPADGSAPAPGDRAWFQGPPGSGKTRASAAIGRKSGKQVDRIDVAALLDGWSEETEKEVARVFAAAMEAGRILLFTAADGLFERRTESRNANDHAANQQVAYLLQRIEDFPGVVILATNLASHIDEAFARRWQILRFPLPGAESEASSTSAEAS